jgi:hypothetical protein
MDYHRIYNELVAHARGRKIEGYTEKHHIIPKCVGGKDVKENLVAFTCNEHFVAHVLLVKMYPEQKNLICAVQTVTMGKRHTRKMYGWIRKKFVDHVREMNTGRRWIHQGQLKKTIQKGVEVPEGWELGMPKKIK